MLAARRHHYVELARPESESALSVEPAPSVERHHRHDAELGRRRRPRHAVFDDGPHGGDLLLACVPGLPAVHGQQHLASERAVYLLPFSHSRFQNGQPFEAAARPKPSAKSSAASLLISISCFTLRSMRIREPPISRVNRLLFLGHKK